MKGIQKYEKGITLIALVTTIVVLLILAGITIAALFNSNGIIASAIKAKEQTRIKSEEEVISRMNLDLKLSNKLEQIGKGKPAPSDIQAYIIDYTSKNGYKVEVGKASENEYIIRFIDSNNIFKYNNETQEIEYIGGYDSSKDVALEEADIKITYTPNEWTNEKIKTKVELKKEGNVELQYSKDRSSWTTYTEEIESEKNETIYIRAINKQLMTIKTTTTAVVDKIDKVVPTIENATGSTTIGNTGTVSVSNMQDTGSGLKGIYISTDATTPTKSSKWISNTNTSYIQSVNTNGSYYVWVIDNANNISERKECSVSGIVSKAEITSFTSSVTMDQGNSSTVTLNYTGVPKNITCTSENTGIATVTEASSSSGIKTYTVRGVAVGSTTLVVTLTNYDNTTVTKNCSVTVNLVYTVTYNSNGGSGKMNETKGVQVTISSNKFTAPSERRFKGWNTSKDGTGTSYTAGNSYNLDKNITLYAQWEINADWYEWLKKAGITSYNSLDDFITKGTSSEKTKVCQNTTARQYLLSNSKLISKLKSNSNYGTGLVPYFLTTNNTTNNDNYNAGLPCYITYGNKLYFGESYAMLNKAYSTYSASNSNYFSISMRALNFSWGDTLRTTKKIDISKFTKAVAKGYRTTSSNCGASCGFATEFPASCIDGAGGMQEIDTTNKEYTFDINSGEYYFGMTVATFGNAVTLYLYYSYIY